MRAHTEERECWCDPVLLTDCPECEGSPEGCWRCQDGVAGAVRALAIDEGPCVIVHDPEPRVRAVR